MNFPSCWLEALRRVLTTYTTVAVLGCSQEAEGSSLLYKTPGTLDLREIQQDLTQKSLRGLGFTVLQSTKERK